MRKFRNRSLVAFLVPVLIASLAGCSTGAVKQSWVVDYKYVDFDPFPGMNVQGRNVQLTQSDINGRVIWNLWSGDNAGFWNWLAKYGFGTGDLLKMIASPRNQRFQTYGVFNQPGYMRPAQANEYGLYIDVPREPGSKYDIDKRLDIPTYGISSGIMGLRLFKNPKFDPAKWDAGRYWNDPNYYKDPKLERPYMVGMACSFCHVGPDPSNPPADPNEMDYGNFSDYVGQHYLKIYEVFAHELGPDNFIKQILLSNPAGSLDTAFIATDYINNPGTMNAVYNLPPPGRVAVAVPEKLVGGSRDLKNLELVGQPDMVLAPRVLKDGADSVGLHGALSRVYLNIGEYWEQWTREFKPLIGIKKQSPIQVKEAQKNSPAWNWSEQASPDLAQYLIKFAKPHKLAATPGGDKYLTASQAELDRGKRVFAANCARCHSSKRPQGIDPHSPDGREWFLKAVMEPDFLDGNMLGSEERVPVTEMKTNASRSMATNGMRGQIWDNFSSETYKNLPAVGAIDVWDPITKTDSQWTLPPDNRGGGRGYYRPPSLVSVWSGAPFLHNNAVGKHVHGVSVDQRMEAFNDGITKMLWPEKRGGANGNKDGADGQSTSLWLTTQESWLKVPESYLHTRTLKHLLRDHLETDPATGERYFAFGPIPKGTPVNLLANTKLELSNAKDLARLFIDTVKVMKAIKNEGLTGDAATKRWLDSPVVKELYRLNSIPDFIEDKGHYFGTDLPDADKRALIEFLKTF